MGVTRLVCVALVGCGRIHFQEDTLDSDARLGDALIDATLTPGLLAYFPLDESTFAGSAMDASGRGHTAVCNSFCPVSTPGRVGGSAQLDGDSYFSIPWQPTIDTPAGFTIAAWILPTVTNVPMLVIGRPLGPFQRNTYALYMPGTGFIELVTANQLGDTLSQAGPLAPTTWQHVAGTWDGSMQRLYIDGVQRDATPAPALVVEARPILIGVDDDNGGLSSYFQGVLDEVRIYDRALSAAEVVQIATP